MEVVMRRSLVLATFATIALGVLAAQTMRGSAVPPEQLQVPDTISPFEMMQTARGLPTQVLDNAF